MDDVIFGGSGRRPARNLAEVALTLDNSARDAPFAFNDRADDRGRRGASSAAPARPTGSTAARRGPATCSCCSPMRRAAPHSGAMVGQGRIGALIDAKPAERRALLEEAAGTAGLHARRREAELKLTRREDNLARLDDVMATIAAQIETLQKQARQAQRYRRLGEQIRRDRGTAVAMPDGGRLPTRPRVSRPSCGDAERELAAASERRARPRAGTRRSAEAALPPLRLRRSCGGGRIAADAHAREALEQELASGVGGARPRPSAGWRRSPTIAIARRAPWPTPRPH